MDIVGAAKAFFESFLAVFTWKTGGRTKDQNTIQGKAETAHEDTIEALDDGDLLAANRALDDQRRVRDEARAKRP